MPKFIHSLPLYYGHLSITDSSFGPRNAKIHTFPTSIIRTSLYYGQFVWSQKCQNSYIPCLYTTDTSLLRTVRLVPEMPKFIHSLPLYYGHLSITDSSFGPRNAKIHTFPTSIIRTSLYYGQFVWSQKCQNSYIPYLYNKDISLLRTVCLVPEMPKFIHSLPLYYGHLSITDSSFGPRNAKIHTFPASILRTSLYYGQFVWSQKCQNSYISYLYTTDTSLLRTIRLVPEMPKFIHSLPLYYGHLSITDSSFGPRNAKNHTLPTSILRTPL